MLSDLWGQNDVSAFNSICESTVIVCGGLSCVKKAIPVLIDIIIIFLGVLDVVVRHSR